MKSKKLQKLRSERCERSFSHVCDSGGMRWSWLRGLEDVTKRYVIAAAAHNLGRILFKLFGVGKPRALQGGYGLAMLVQFIITVVLGSVTTLLATTERQHGRIAEPCRL